MESKYYGLDPRRHDLDSIFLLYLSHVSELLLALMIPEFCKPVFQRARLKDWFLLFTPAPKKARPSPKSRSRPRPRVTACGIHEPTLLLNDGNGLY
jgi:hypothetical protein